MTISHIFFCIELKLSTVVTLITKLHDMKKMKMKINPKLKLTLYVVVQINFILVSFILYLLSYITIHKKKEDNVELQQVERWLSTQPFNCCELWMHFTHRIEFVRKYFLFLNSIHRSVFVFLSSLQWCVFTWGWGHHCWCERFNQL